MLTNLSSSTSRKFFTDNYILQSLPSADLSRLLPDLKEISLTRGQVLYNLDESIQYLYFPNHALISLIAVTDGGESAEVGVIGGEGIIGTDLLLGVDTSFNTNLVQIQGTAWQIEAEAVKKEFMRGEAFHELSLQFVRLLMFQISQTAVCNRLHTIEQRLSRWLLLCRDRTKDDKLPLTQEFLATMLGTSRATVTLAAIELQNAGCIKYSRGKIIILDRQGLEQFTCSCYKTVKQQYDRWQN